MSPTKFWLFTEQKEIIRKSYEKSTTFADYRQGIDDNRNVFLNLFKKECDSFYSPIKDDVQEVQIALNQRYQIVIANNNK